MTCSLPIQPVNVSVIIVSYQSADELRTLIPHLVRDAPAIGFEIIVVDNASTDDTPSVLAAFRSKIKTIINTENGGFAAAVNQGFQLSDTQYMLLLNPDALVPAETIQVLRDYLNTHHDIAAVAPRLEYPDGRIQPSRGSFPSVLRTVAHLFRLKRLMPDDETVIKGPLRVLGRFFKQYAPLPGNDQAVDYTTGACVMLRRSAVMKVGGMDESFFLYYEEIDLARRLRDEGYGWVFLNAVSAVHTVAVSSDKSPLRPFYERYRSMCTYFRKHHPPLSAFIVRQLLYIMILSRWGLVLLSHRFRLDPKVPLKMETDVYRKLVGRRKTAVPKTGRLTGA